jgi:hypothetical protein
MGHPKLIIVIIDTEEKRWEGRDKFHGGLHQTRGLVFIFAATQHF